MTLSTMTKYKRLKRLDMLADMLERHDEIFIKGKKCAFDITHWVMNGISSVVSEKNGSNTCGTSASACALGAAALYEPFVKQGLQVDYGDVMYNGHEAYHAGEEFFGITYRESTFLFNPDKYYIKYAADEDGDIDWRNTSSFDSFAITAEIVAKRVRLLIERYKTPKRIKLPDLDLTYGVPNV